MKYSAIILAGGSSSRFGEENKLLFKINNKTIIEHSIEHFLNDNDCLKVIVVINSKYEDIYKKLLKNKKIQFVNGGKTRHDSFLNGFNYCVDCEYIMVHDAARPFLSSELISNIKKEFLLDKKLECVVPILNISDSILSIDNNKIEYLNRDQIKIVQTPQAFKNKLVKSIIKVDKKNSYNDEFSWVISNKNIRYKIILGDKNNLKITYKNDI